MTDAARTRPDLSRSAVPRYVQLAELFRSRIAAGTWAVGSQIPTVDDLVEECGVARATIRHALDMLETDGLIERFRAKGTFVARSPVEKVWCEVKTDWAGLMMSRDGVRIEVLSDKAEGSPPDLALHGGVFAGSYRHLRRRHAREGEYYMLADLYVDEALRGTIPDSAYRSQAALRMIANVPGVNIVNAGQTLTIGIADVETSSLLGVPLNLPVAFVNRYVIDDRGIVLLVSKGIYRGDVVHLDMRLK